MRPAVNEQPPRRFPPPWHVDDAGDGEVLRVVDAGGQILAYVLYEDESVRRDLMKRLTKDEASDRGQHRQAAGAAGGVKGVMKPIGFIVPAQPVGAKVPPAGPGWLHEIKHDGFRLMGWRNSDRVRLLTRNGTDFTDRFPLVAEAIGKLPARSCLIDGEIAVCNGMGLSVFDMLRHGPRVKRNAVLFSFDLLELDGRDLRMEPIESRKAELEQLLRDAPTPLQWLDHLEVEGPIMFELVCTLGAEGIVSKRKGSRYVSGRCDAWRKAKNPAAPAVRREAEEDWGKKRWR